MHAIAAVVLDKNVQFQDHQFSQFSNFYCRGSVDVISLGIVT